MLFAYVPRTDESTEAQPTPLKFACELAESPAGPPTLAP